jgi:hypothetical protein
MVWAWLAWGACAHRASGTAPLVVYPAYRIEWGTSDDGREVQLWVTELIPVDERPVEVVVDFHLVGAHQPEIEWTEGPFRVIDGAVPVLTFRSPVSLSGRPFYVGGSIHRVLADGSESFRMGIPSAYVWSGDDGLPRVAPEWWVEARLPPNTAVLTVDLSEAIDEAYRSEAEVSP